MAGMLTRQQDMPKGKVLVHMHACSKPANHPDATYETHHFCHVLSFMFGHLDT